MDLKFVIYDLFVCWGLMSFLNSWGHIATLPSCSSVNVLPLDMTHRHSIQTQGWPVVVLSIDVERHTGIHNNPLLCLWADPIGKSFLDLPHTPVNAQLYDAVILVVIQKLGRKCTVPVQFWTQDLWCANPLRLSARPQLLLPEDPPTYMEHSLFNITKSITIVFIVQSLLDGPEITIHPILWLKSRSQSRLSVCTGQNWSIQSAI